MKILWCVNSIQMCLILMGPFKWKILSTKCTQFLQKKQAAPSVPITYQRFRADNGDHYDIFTLCGRIRNQDIMEIEIVLFLLLASSCRGFSQTSSVTASGLELQTNHRRSYNNHREGPYEGTY